MSKNDVLTFDTISPFLNVKFKAIKFLSIFNHVNFYITKSRNLSLEFVQNIIHHF